jgi:hypothetical protein
MATPNLRKSFFLSFLNGIGFRQNKGMLLTFQLLTRKVEVSSENLFGYVLYFI